MCFDGTAWGKKHYHMDRLNLLSFICLGLNSRHKLKKVYNVIWSFILSVGVTVTRPHPTRHAVSDQVGSAGRGRSGPRASGRQSAGQRAAQSTTGTQVSNSYYYHRPYEGLNLANQKSRKLRVFGRKSVGSHSSFD